MAVSVLVALQIRLVHDKGSQMVASGNGNLLAPKMGYLHITILNANGTGTNAHLDR